MEFYTYLGTYHRKLELNRSRIRLPERIANIFRSRNRYLYDQLIPNRRTIAVFTLLASPLIEGDEKCIIYYDPYAIGQVLGELTDDERFQKWVSESGALEVKLRGNMLDVPRELCSRVSIDRHVTLVGRCNVFELWHPAYYEQWYRVTCPNYDQMFEKFAQ